MTRYPSSCVTPPVVAGRAEAGYRGCDHAVGPAGVNAAGDKNNAESHEDDSDKQKRVGNQRCLLYVYIMSIMCEATAERDEAELLAGAGRGDNESLHELYTRYSPLLLSTAHRVLNNSRDAEEVLQETFVQL